MISGLLKTKTLKKIREISATAFTILLCNSNESWEQDITYIWFLRLFLFYYLDLLKV